MLILSPSLFDRKSAKIGERLNKVQPIPIGKNLNAICWNNIPKLVPSKVDKTKFEWLFWVIDLLDKSLKKSLLKNKNKNMEADKSLISVDCKGVKVELIKITLDIKAAKTAQKTDPNALRIPISFTFLEWFFHMYFVEQSSIKRKRQ